MERRQAGNRSRTSSSSGGLVAVVAAFFVVLCVAAETEATSSSWFREGCGSASGLVSVRRGVATRDALCCEGKNNSCVANGPRLNAFNSTKCFCDANCLTAGDCCVDYKQSCQSEPVNCQLANTWGNWSQCDVQCGRGKKHRRRPVVVEAKNGGRPCSKQLMVQTVSCVGTNCRVPRSIGSAVEASETGRIVPAVFATWRHSKLYNPLRDIRKNLFEHHGDAKAINRPSYCARYEITDVHSTCRKMSRSAPLEWPSRLRRGVTVCVECQSSAMHRDLGSRCRGHGVLHRTTPWNAVGVHGCHGKWKLVSKHSHQRCSGCDPQDEFSFIFV